jgi:hypothetical protein
MFVDPIQNGIWKTVENSFPDRAMNHGPGKWVLNNCFETTVYFVQKSIGQTWFFGIVKISRIQHFPFGIFVKINA